jgi:peptide/nickel transport system permease protein
MGMRSYLVKRIAIGLVTLFIIATFNFVIFQVIYAGDPTKTIITPGFTYEQKQMLYRQYGLNETLATRYAKYIQSMFTWNFGYSFHTMGPISEEMSWRLPNTVLLLGTALIGTLLLGTPIGILAGSRRGSKTDMVAMAGGLFTSGVPTFFIQMIFLLFFTYLFMIWFGFQFFPPGRMVSTPPWGYNVATKAIENPLAYVADVAWHLAMPALSLIVAGFGGYALYVRNLMIDSLTQDYVLTAHAKGLSERTVLYRHAFRATLPPIATMIALAIPGLVTGAIITEYIFTWPGIGSWYIAGLSGDDFPVVQSVLFIYAILTIACNLIADLMYGVLDPRVRVGVRR